MNTDPLAKYPFHVGRYDQKHLEAVKNTMPPWGKVLRNRTKECNFFGDVMDSMFMSLYKDGTIPKDLSECSPQAPKIQKLLSVAQALPEWEKLKRPCTYDYRMSGIITTVISETVPIPEEPPGDGGKGDEGEEGDPDLSQDQRDALVGALREAVDMAENMEALASAWGEEIGEHLERDPSAFLALAKSMSHSSRMKLLVLMLGRMKNHLAHAKKSKDKYSPEEFVDITYGNTLADVMPNEYLYLMLEEAELLFLHKYANRTLMQQHKEGRSPLSKGPIVGLIDISSSMSSPIGVFPGVGRISRLDWAAAVGLTLLTMAKQQNRNAYLCLFDTAIRKEYTFSKDAANPLADLQSLLAITPAGGTNFERPLLKGLDKITESEYSQADVVFITDGDCSVSQKVLDIYTETKKSKGFKMVSVVCAERTAPVLTDISDEVVTVQSIFDADRVATQIFSLGE